MLVLGAFGVLDWGVVGIYFALVTAVGLVVGRRRKGEGEREYFLGGRSLPTWAVAVSLVATMLSTATFVGVPDAAFGGDLSYLGLSVGGIIAVFVVALLFVPRLYAAGTVTIYGFLAQRYGEGARVAVSCAFIVGRMLASGARLFLAAIPLCLLLFGPQTPSVGELVAAILLIGVVGTVYTTQGGVRAVVWVDVIQFGLVVGTALLTIAIILHKVPASLSEIVQALAHTPVPPNGSVATAPSKLQLLDFSTDLRKPYTVLAAVVGISFLNTAAFGTDQDLAQRFLITKSARGGAVSVIASQFIGMAVVFLFLCIGLLLHVFYQRPELSGAVRTATENGRSVYPWFLLNELPTGLAGAAVAGFFAIAQGSLDSAMNALASSIVADVVGPLRRKTQNSKLKTQNPAGSAGAETDGFRARDGAVQEEEVGGEASKLVVASVGAALCLFAMGCAAVYDPKHRSLLDFVQGIMAYALSGMLGVFAAALFTRRGNSASVAAGLIVGAAAVTLMQDAVMSWWTRHLLGSAMTLAWPWTMPIATVLAFAVCVVPPGKAPLREGLGGKRGFAMVEGLD